MLAYISPATSNTNSPRNSNAQLPVVMPHSTLSRSSANATTASRGSAPASATTSPLFQPSHPATPPAFALASPHPVRLNVLGKSISTLGAVSSKASSAGTPSKGMDHLGLNDNFCLDDASALETASPEPVLRHCKDLKRALQEFEDNLLDEVESSGSSSDASDVGEMEMDGSVRRTRKGKTSTGWKKGVARDTPRFQLIVDVPLWTPGCFQDLSSMQDVRDRTLSSLHKIVDNLRLRGGVRTTYRLLSTANGGSWGCIRVAPFMSSSTSHGHQSFINRNEQKPMLPGALRRSTFAGPALSRQLFGAGGSVDSTGFLSAHANLHAGGTSEDEKQEVARVVKLALEKDGDGMIPESKVYLLALQGQPALIIT